MAAKSTRKKKTTRKKSSKNQASTSLNSEILILVMFAVCVLMLLSNFGVIGIAGSAISSVLFGFFGVMAYILPFLLFGVVAFGISNKGNTHAYIKIAACVALLFAICAFFQLVMHPFDAKESLWSYYQYASDYRKAGGLTGGCLVNSVSVYWCGRRLCGTRCTYGNLCDSDHRTFSACTSWKRKQKGVCRYEAPAGRSICPACEEQRRKTKTGRRSKDRTE